MTCVLLGSAMLKASCEVINEERWQMLSLIKKLDEKDVKFIMPRAWDIGSIPVVDRFFSLSHARDMMNIKAFSFYYQA